MLEVKNIVKYYGHHLAVNDISFSLEEGKIYGLLGPNGAGKSTTMNIITGYIGATSGQVLIDGNDILEEPEKAKKNLGYLPEIPPLYKDMTIDEFLLFVAELKGVDKKEKKQHVADIEERVKIAHFHDKLIKNLSKGYRQRVGFAAALISYPKLIILDEPTVGLDPMQINEMREIILSLKKDHTVILSSHIMQEVAAVCDEIIIIAGGKLIARGTPDEIEKKQHAVTSISYKLKASADSVSKVLKSLDYITNFTIENSNDTTLDLNVETKLSADEVIEKLYLKLAENKIIILECKENKNSLEDLFVNIVKDNTSKEVK